MTKRTLYPKTVVSFAAALVLLVGGPLSAQQGWPYPDLKKQPQTNEAILQQVQLNQIWLANHAAMAQAMNASANSQNGATPRPATTPQYAGQQFSGQQFSGQQFSGQPISAQTNAVPTFAAPTKAAQPAVGRYGGQVSAHVPPSTATRPTPIAAQSPYFTPSLQASLPTVPATLVSTQDLLGGEDSKSDESADSSALDSMGPSKGGIRSPHGVEKPLRDGLPEGQDPHIDLFLENCYPSANTCAKCHPKVYEEWRGSAHAYAGVSPMFNRFEMAIAQLSSGTIGTFCLRCHAPVAMHLGRPREASLVDYEHVVREGVTCVACHRVAEAYNKHNGERRIESGSVFDPVFGSTYGEGLARAIAEKDKYKIKVDPNDKRPGQSIHLTSIKFDQLADSSFCASCHQVAVHPGIALEVVWAQYRAGPACKKGVSCQDCHMGIVPGKANGYEMAHIAEISGKPVNEPRKHASHMFWGPITPIAHPGLFPHNEKSNRWSIDDWLNFDWRSGWGSDAYEKSPYAKQASYPKKWDSADERRDARKVIDENLKLTQIKRIASTAVMEGASKIDGPFFAHQPQCGQDLKFHFVVSNTSEGHNMPSGSLGAQPQLWLNVVLISPSGQRVWESGHLDSHGDVCNQHSKDVTSGRIPADNQLFNLQTQFLITGVKGTDREMYLPINVDIDQLPFLRPGAQPISVLNHPPFIRMEAHSIPPLGNKVAKYRVPSELLTERGTYRLSARLRSRMEPIYFMEFVNATEEMKQRMIEATLDIHPFSVQFEVR
ncbi:MAG: multiheme c-type cytochrome [Pirellulales bacterium]